MFTSDELARSLMGHIPFTWLPMNPDAAAATLTADAAVPAAPIPIPTPTTTTDAAAMQHYYLNSWLHASLMQPAVVQTATEEARRRQDQEEEAASIRLVHLLITCTGAIQAGDYSVAHGNLTEARAILKKIPTSTGIGRVGTHFTDALAQRLFPAYPHAAALPSCLPPATPPATYNHFYDAGPYLKFAYSAANRAILKAFEGCKRVHIIDFALMQGLQWPALMEELSKREGGPPELRITGIGPNPTSGRDELHEVGVRLAEFARYMKIPFTFQGVCADHLDHLTAWIHLKLRPDEALAMNSILQLHRLLVDPDADESTMPAPIDILLKLVVKLKPKIFTVVEQEADHNKPRLLERFTNALFHYATMFDSLEAVCSAVNVSAAAARSSTNTSTTSSLAEAYLRGEIFDIICGEGNARLERHELCTAWNERLTRAGFTQVEFNLSEANMEITELINESSFSGAGFDILQGSGGLALAWQGRPLYVATAWHAMGGGNAASAAIAHTKEGDSYQKGKNSSGSGGGKGNRGRCGVAGGITFL